ncbi:MAG: chemotaxis protein CheW, partial [Thermodesulfobacteriota bacterium]
TPVPLSTESRIIILKSEAELSHGAVEKGIHTSLDTLALLVDRIGDVVDAAEDDVEPAPPHLSSTYVSGIIKKSGELLILLSTEWLCTLEESTDTQIASNQ